jgi:hypothetical protein
MLKNNEAFNMKRFFAQQVRRWKLSAWRIAEITRVDLNLSIYLRAARLLKRVDPIPEAHRA